MDIFNIISLIGGLAIFLFGMQVMGDSLEKTAGNKLKSILENLTSSRFKGLLLGLVVTAIIQSSSATTVMVVGFINSGIMQLSQSVGIIMGANIGTTVTGWLLSTTGMSGGGSFILEMLKPSSFAPVLALVGIVLMMFSKKQKHHDVGGILLGFAVLMTGMETMSAAVDPLKDMPEFAEIFLLFKNPILGVLTGALLTAVIQSSSASVGILQALSVTGSVTFGSAIPIILGQGIGTCVTAMLSAIGANRNAKRAASIHLSFNILGSIIFLILFYVLHAIFQFSFIDKAVNPFTIAVINTTFKVVSTLVLFPFGGALERLSYLFIPEKGQDKAPELLDDRLFATPGIAVRQAKKLTDRMSIESRESIVMAMNILEKFDEETAEKIVEIEKTIDTYEDKLGTYLVKLSRENLSMDDSHQISNLLHTIGDFERIADHAVNIRKVALEIHEKGLEFSESAKKEIKTVTAAVNEIMEMTVKAFTEENTELAKQVEPLEQVIDVLKKQMKARHISRLQQGECTIETGFVFSDLITNYERIADHCSNIAVCLIQIANDSFETHEYLDHVKHDGQNDFEERFKAYSEKYSI